jgi:hypothetical protein
MLKLSATYKNSILGDNTHDLLGNEASKNKKLVDMYKKLADIMTTINTLLSEYSKGNIPEVASILTQDAYHELSIKLAALAVPATKYPEYETIRASTRTTLAGLYQSIIQYVECVNCEEQLAVAKENESILYDPVKLKEYIEKLKRNRYLFPESNVQVISASLKPEYAAYIRLFGFPEGAVFETDRLAFVLNQLGMA